MIARPMMQLNKTPGEHSMVRLLLQVPAQPELSDPQEFFKRMDLLKQPMASMRTQKMKISEFFALYEDHVKDY